MSIILLAKWVRQQWPTYESHLKFKGSWLRCTPIKLRHMEVLLSLTNE